MREILTVEDYHTIKSAALSTCRRDSATHSRHILSVVQEQARSYGFDPNCPLVHRIAGEIYGLLTTQIERPT